MVVIVTGDPAESRRSSNCILSTLWTLTYGHPLAKAGNTYAAIRVVGWPSATIAKPSPTIVAKVDKTVEAIIATKK